MCLPNAHLQARPQAKDHVCFARCFYCRLPVQGLLQDALFSKMYNCISQLRSTFVTHSASMVPMQGSALCHIKKAHIFTVGCTGSANLVLNGSKGNGQNSYGPVRHEAPHTASTCLNIHVSVKLRQGFPRQATAQVESITVLRHYVLHLEEKETGLRTETVSWRVKNKARDMHRFTYPTLPSFSHYSASAKTTRWQGA